MESILDILNIPLSFLLRAFYSLTDNYLTAVLLFTILVEIILLPLAIKQQKSQIKQASLAPKTEAIRKKYAGRTDQATQQKMNEEIQEMYKRENFNPASGCGPLLIQFPIIISLFNVVTRPLRYICNLSSASVEQLESGLEDLLENTSRASYIQYDIINYIRENGGIENFKNLLTETDQENIANISIPDFSLGALDLSKTPSVDFLADIKNSVASDWIVLMIPVVTFAVMILSQLITQKFSYQSPETKAQQENCSMKLMMWSMPLLSVYFEFQMPAVVGVYWIFRNLISTGERVVLSKMMPLPKFTEEDYKEAERQANMSNKQKKKENHAKVRSLHHIDDEEWLAKHAQEEKEQEEKDAAEEKQTVGETTETSGAIAPIKNDEKTRYKAKDKSDDK